MDLTVQGYFVKSLSPSTLQSHKSVTQCYLVFCHNFGIGVAFPLSEVILGHVVAFLPNKHLSYVTICVYLVLFASIRLLLVFLNPHFLLSCIWAILQGIRRSLPQDKRPKRLPITPDILRSLFCVWSHPPVTYDTVMLWAACCTGFFS